MGTPRKRLDDGRDLVGGRPIHEQHLPERRCSPEVLSCRWLADHDHSGARQEGAPAAFHEREREDVDQRGIGKIKLVFVERAVAIPDGMVPQHSESRGGLHPRHFGLEGLGHGGAAAGGQKLLVPYACVQRQAVNSVGMLVESVVRELIIHQQGNKDETAGPDGQPDDVDEGVAFLPEQSADRDQQIVPEHRRLPFSGWGIALTPAGAARIKPERTGAFTCGIAKSLRSPPSGIDTPLSVRGHASAAFRRLLCCTLVLNAARPRKGPRASTPGLPRP